MAWIHYDNMMNCSIRFEQCGFESHCRISASLQSIVHDGALLRRAGLRQRAQCDSSSAGSNPLSYMSFCARTRICTHMMRVRIRVACHRAEFDVAKANNSRRHTFCAAYIRARNYLCRDNWAVAAAQSSNHSHIILQIMVCPYTL